MTLPTEVATADGLAYSLWLPDGGRAARGGARWPGAARGRVVILHGAGSVKESHHDFARYSWPRALARSCSTSAATARATAPMDDAVAARHRRDGRVLRERLGDPPRRSACAARAWAATSRSSPPTGRRPRRGGHLPGQRRGSAARTRGGRVALRRRRGRVGQVLPPHTTSGRRSPGCRPRSSSCTPRVTRSSRSPTRASSPPACAIPRVA